MPTLNDFNGMGINQGFDGKFRQETVNFDTNKATTVTPNDSTDLPGGAVWDGVYIGTAGDVKVTMNSGDIVTFVGLQAGIVHRISVRRIWATGTTATNIIALQD